MTKNSSDLGSADDQQAMSSFRYAQELRRTIRFFGSLPWRSHSSPLPRASSIITSHCGKLGSGWNLDVAAGHLGQLLVALVFAKLPSKIP
ncbi:MAG: hypothetical protein Ct9H300mP1_24810 [Planctomycetaceae bacterium]|nr:MAG: hypothetical protein Ct9H300mP1_24810 [Planctomycetaceae bacterium]